MHKLLSVIVTCISLFLMYSCNKPQLEIEEEVIAINISEELSQFTGTRASAPLEGTIWEYSTSDTYNKYLYFNEHSVNLFYGLVDDGELQRWSDYYTSPYEYDNAEITTNLSYTYYGEPTEVEKVTVIKYTDNFSLLIDEEEYHFYGTDASTIEGQWIIIIVGIEPWN